MQIYRETIHNPRSSCCESFFHALDIWLPKWAGFSRWGYFLGRDCVMLCWNENIDQKILTSGQITKSKTHAQQGLLVAQQQWAWHMWWWAQLFQQLFPSSELVAQHSAWTEQLLTT